MSEREKTDFRPVSRLGELRQTRLLENPFNGPEENWLAPEGTRWNRFPRGNRINRRRKRKKWRGSSSGLTGEAAIMVILRQVLFFGAEVLRPLPPPPS